MNYIVKDLIREAIGDFFHVKQGLVVRPIIKKCNVIQFNIRATNFKSQ